MTSILEFRKEAISQMEKDFSKLQLPPESKQGIARAAQLYAQFIPMSELALRGFMAMTMRDFQIQEKLDAGTINKFSRDQAEMYVRKMAKIFQDKLEKVLLRPEQKSALYDAVRKGIEFSIKMMG